MKSLHQPSQRDMPCSGELAISEMMAGFWERGKFAVEPASAGAGTALAHFAEGKRAAGAGSATGGGERATASGQG